MDIFELNLRHLCAAVAVAKSGSINAAALEISLSQPAITQGLNGIERQLDIQLFDRHPGGMAVTDAGLLLTARMAEAMATIRQAPSRSGRARGPVSIMASGC